jgi:hypothetical protein
MRHITRTMDVLQGSMNSERHFFGFKRDDFLALLALLPQCSDDCRQNGRRNNNYDQDLDVPFESPKHSCQARRHSQLSRSK